MRILLPFLLLCPALAGATEPALHTTSKSFTLRNGDAVVHYDRRAGRIDINWADGHALHGITSGAQLADGTHLATDAYTSHELTADTPVEGGHEYTIRSSKPGLPTLLQHIWLYDGKPWLAMQAELDAGASRIGTRHFDAVEWKGADAVLLGDSKDLRLLHVPFDNDMWFRYDSMAIGGMTAGQSYGGEEVTAIYSNSSRQALVLGSITHDVWKTAIEAHAANGKLTDLSLYGGIASPTGVRTDTHDTVPHGIVHGERVESPRIFIGSFADWRKGLGAYGAANAAVQPPLRWPAGAPVGWNSWAAYGDKIDEQRYLNAANYVRDTLVPQGFSRDGVVYINFDAFWSSLDALQLADAVQSIQSLQGANGVRFKPGIYWTPFAYWSENLDAYVEGTRMKYRYRDILLKAPDGSLLPKVDGGRAIDPSSEGARERTAFYIAKFKELGFAYLKLDFLSHGTLEGVHADPAIQTGIEAYNEGMRQIVEANAGKMFLSLSIAPLFPSGYGHARRLSCDTKGHIGDGDQSTEYMLNSLTYGWWTDGNLYITDPDHVVLGDKADLGARSVQEGRSRLLSAIVSGGMILDSSRLADDPQGQQFARAVYDNPRLFTIAAERKTFYPVEGDTGNKAAAVFMRPSENGFYIAMFNYDDKAAHTVSIPLARVAPGLARGQSAVRNVATGQSMPGAAGTLALQLPPAGSMLVEVHAAH